MVPRNRGVASAAWISVRKAAIQVGVDAPEGCKGRFSAALNSVRKAAAAHQQLPRDQQAQPAHSGVSSTGPGLGVGLASQYSSRETLRLLRTAHIPIEALELTGRWVNAAGLQMERSIFVYGYHTTPLGVSVLVAKRRGSAGARTHRCCASSS